MKWLFSNGGKRMLRFGICTRGEFLELTKQRDCSGSAISYKLLEISEGTTEEDMEMFECIQLRLRTSNGTFRTTFRNRFRDLDAAVMDLLRSTYRTDAGICVQDRAASHALTSFEWAEQLFRAFPGAEFEASDSLLYLWAISLAAGETYIVEPSGKPLQWIKPPFVVSLCQREPLRYPLNHFVAACAKRQFRRFRLENRPYRVGQDGANKISCVHPKARCLASSNPRFRIVTRSIFEHTLGVDVLRTMNIFNKSYFSENQIIDGMEAAFHSLKPGGIWIVGRTWEHDLTNHATVFKREETAWKVMLRIGAGWELEELASRVQR
jgi:hypothetical protein